MNASHTFDQKLALSIEDLRAKGLFKPERRMSSPQGAKIRAEGKPSLNLCANNYLGLANHPTLVQAAKQALDEYGFGLASVRFICGTQDLHKNLEARIAAFVGTEDAILYSSCFDANGGLFETLLGPEDAVISDALNHASIIDGIRLCKAQRYRYANRDLKELEMRLQEASSARTKLVVTDGVFSMDGFIADLPAIRKLCDQYEALLMVDDSHAVGFMGAQGRGTPEHHNMLGQVDIITGTLGKALGGASGGYTAASKSVVTWLRQRSRPYLFSNTLAPSIAGAAIAALDLLAADPSPIRQLHRLTEKFRREMTQLGFNILPGTHPIVPVMLGQAKLAGQMAEELFAEGVYVIGFSYPVVPENQARIRVQMSAALDDQDLDFAIKAFAKVGRKLGIIDG